MGVSLEKNIREKLYSEFDDISKKQIDSIINNGMSSLLKNLQKDIDVVIRGNNKEYDGLFFGTLFYGKLKKYKRRIQRNKHFNRKRVNVFLNKKRNEQEN